MHATIMIGLAAVTAQAIAQPVAAQEQTKETAIALPGEGRSVSFEGAIRGYGAADYVFRAPAGRALRVELETASKSTYFNIIQDGKDEALFVGSLGGNLFDAALPEQGTYRVKVYQMRNAARKGATAHYELRVR
ncbi:hypothetical protein [Massilia timonae]|jgi:hypothetical protein|uniref:DNA breaking-rejoining protein n=1 Tax=Massilia timonae CCUG 45783 TaxID=883126 RepID=K9D4U8_9BURK|nr:hypothetical protein [Massilia timonae]EKU79649.1 hypothetical protein HMPREF9710_05131 [Massilia timonae CCUG 45783]